jgi:hypothetical protein
MRKKIIALAVVAVGALGVFLYYSSLQKPEQINRVLRIDANRPNSLTEIVSAVASRADMKVESQDFDYGGKSGTLKAFLIYDSRVSVMVRGTSNEECHPMEGRRDPSFSGTIYGVSIYRTSMFKPKMPLREIAKVVEEEARQRGGELITEGQKCEDRPSESPNPSEAR